MRAAALDNAALRVEDKAFIDDVFAIAPDVTVDDDGTRMEFVARPDRCEPLPLLPRVQIAKDVRQIPIMPAEYGRVQDESRGDRSSQR